MRKYILILLLLTSISSVIASFEKDMKYHNEPYYYANWGTEAALACFFKLSDFGISGYDYKIKIIGFIGYNADGSADIYLTSKEEWDGYKLVPVCNPKNNWQGKDYGPKSWHINNSYPDYDDCNLYDDNWHYSKDVDKFWCIYYLMDMPPPYPTGDRYSSIVNSLTWVTGMWIKGIPGGFPDSNWCMHCVIVYWGSDIENTSLGSVKALFR
jgi:hypothetical protein